MIALWDHQKRAIELGKQRKHLALLLDMGTGKTATAVHILRNDYNQAKRIRRTLIFAPLSVCAQWKQEFAKFSKVPQERIHVLTMAGVKRVKLLKEMVKDAIVVTNYEAVGIKAFYEALLDWGPEIVVADEAHRLKNSGSSRAKKIYPLSMAADRRFILTGTLFTNSMLDVFGPFRFLDPEIFGSSFWKFRQIYFYDKNARMPSHVHFPDWQPMPDAKIEISGILAATSVQARKEECLSLPPLVKVVTPVTITGAQLKSYQAMEREYVAELKGKIVISEFAMTIQLRLRQILAGFLSNGSDDQPVYFDENPRIDALEDILDGIGTQKCIVWANFKPSYVQIRKLLDKMGLTYAFLTGEQTTGQKAEALQKFKGMEAQVLVSNPSAGGTGLNLSEAPYSVYFDKSFHLEHYLQSAARNYRAGSEIHGRVTQYSLSCTGTIDEAIEAALEGKEDLGRSILEWARQKTLAHDKGMGDAPFQEGEDTQCQNQSL